MEPEETGQFSGKVVRVRGSMSAILLTSMSRGEDESANKAPQGPTPAASTLTRSAQSRVWMGQGAIVIMRALAG